MSMTRLILVSFVVVMAAKKGSVDESNFNNSGQNVKRSIENMDTTNDDSEDPTRDPLDDHHDYHLSAPSEKIDYNFGILSVLNDDHNTDDDDDDDEYCIYHYNGYHMASTKNQSKSYKLINQTITTQICNHNYDGSSDSDNNTIWLISYENIYQSNSGVNNCDIMTLSENIYRSHSNYIKGIMIYIPEGIKSSVVTVENRTSVPLDKFIISIISYKSAHLIFRHVNPSSDGPLVKIYSPPETNRVNRGQLDLSLGVIWIIAVFTVCLGSYWSGKVRYELFQQKRFDSLSSEVMSGGDDDEDDEEIRMSRRKKKKKPEEEPYLQVSPMTIFIFVGCMGLMLMALYYFFSKLVYFIIGLFVLASIQSTYVCSDVILTKILPKNLRNIKIKLWLKKKSTPVYQLILLIISASLSIFWFMTRKKSYSWITQDILGVLFALNMLRTIRLPSFKICFILLSLLFFYDIFFVFLTPLMTSSGDSIMVEVATGGGSRVSSHSDHTNTANNHPNDDNNNPNTLSSTDPLSQTPSSSLSSSPSSPTNNYNSREQLPMVLIVPHLSISKFNESDPLDRICYADIRSHSYSLLGFGDILVPGLLVSYCHAFDLIHTIQYRPYYLVNCIAYSLGLIVTFVGLFLMQGLAQPALLYLVPFTLIPPIIISWIFRGEFRKFWMGPGDGSILMVKAAVDDHQGSSDHDTRNSTGGTLDTSTAGDHDEDEGTGCGVLQNGDTSSQTVNPSSGDVKT